eukprot:EG_transcript_35652
MTNATRQWRHESGILFLILRRCFIPFALITRHSASLFFGNPDGSSGNFLMISPFNHLVSNHPPPCFHLQDKQHFTVLYFIVGQSPLPFEHPHQPTPWPTFPN